MTRLSTRVSMTSMKNGGMKKTLQNQLLRNCANKYSAGLVVQNNLRLRSHEQVKHFNFSSDLFCLTIYCPTSLLLARVDYWQRSSWLARSA